MSKAINKVLSEDFQTSLVTEPKTDAERRYELQMEIVNRLEQKWRAQRCAVTAKGGATGKATVPHPVAVMLQEALLRAARLEEALTPAKKNGRPVGATSAPDRQAPPRLTVAR